MFGMKKYRLNSRESYNSLVYEVLLPGMTMIEKRSEVRQYTDFVHVYTFLYFYATMQYAYSNLNLWFLHLNRGAGHWPVARAYSRMFSIRKV